MVKSTARSLVRDWTSTVSVVLVGSVYAAVTSHLPPVQVSSDVWLANLSAPYLVVPFLTAWLVPVRGRTPWRQWLVAFVALQLMFTGFFGRIRENQGGTWVDGLVDFSLRGWGPYILLAAFGMGLGAWLAWRWRWLWPLVAALPCLEAIMLASNVMSRINSLPNLWRTNPAPFTYNAHNLTIWLGEFAVGAALVAATWHRSAPGRVPLRSRWTA